MAQFLYSNFCSVCSKNLKLYSVKDLILQAKYIKYLLFFRGGGPDVFCKKGALRNFAKIHGKTPGPESLF